MVPPSGNGRQQILLYAGTPVNPVVLASGSNNPTGAENQQATTAKAGKEPQRLNEEHPKG